MKLSVVIASVNDPCLQGTIDSLRLTAGTEVEIIVVDDASATTANVAGADLIIRNRYRCGCGASRHIGAMAASGDWLLITDAHMVFTQGWYERAMKRLEGKQRTLFCGTCLGLSKNNMDPHHPEAVYENGGTLNVSGPDQNDTRKWQVLEVVWQRSKVADDAEIPAVIGADYFIPRDWFLELSPLKHLRAWGEDELMLSLKAWLSGGEVRLMKHVRIGHRFRYSEEAPPFRAPIGYPTWNKLFAIYTLLPEDAHQYFSDVLEKTVLPQEWKGAQELLRSEWSTIVTERIRNARLLPVTFASYCSRFGLIQG